jgi:uncharacterized protein
MAVEDGSSTRHRPGRGERSARCSDTPPERLRRGIEQFNRGEFFEQHETLEEEWIAERDPVRYLYQGILQIGVGFEHLRRGNPAGARALWLRGIGYLEPFRGGCMNVDVDRLVAATKRCLAELERVGDGGLERFDDGLIPRVEWLRDTAPVTPKGNVETLRRAMDSGDPAALFALLHEQVEWDYVGAFPESATYYGPEGVQKFFGQWTGAFDDFGFAAEEFIDAGDSVVMHLRQWGRGKDTGAQVENRTWQVFTFRDGKIVHCRGYPSKAEALQAAGLGQS